MDSTVRAQGKCRANGRLRPLRICRSSQIHTDDGLWPLRVKPYPGELFSSWLVRLARCYELPIEVFCRAVWPGRKIWHADIDRNIEDEALELLSKRTGVAYSELFSMTLRSHERHACPSDPEAARDLYFRYPTSDQATRYCPACLAEPEPYFRLEWRLAFVTMCALHELVLVERCAGCGAPCLFAKLQLHRPFGCCHNCNRRFMYVDERIPKPNPYQIPAQLELQKQLLTFFGRR
jgi:hypothetical protein